MKINWKVRFKNPVFILQALGSLFVPILAYFGFRWEDLTTWHAIFELLYSAVQNPFVLGTALYSFWCAITNPVTKGFGDGEKLPN